MAYFSYTNQTKKVLDAMAEVLRGHDCDVTSAKVELTDPSCEKRFESYYLTNVSTVGQDKTPSPWGTCDEAGNVVQILDTVAPQPPGYKFLRNWHSYHGACLRQASNWRSRLSATLRRTSESSACTHGSGSVWASSGTSRKWSGGGVG
jgi:hypothetical protein